MADIPIQIRIGNPQSGYFRHQTEKKYCVPQKLPQIYNAITYICIGKAASFAVYICGNILNALYVYVFKQKKNKCIIGNPPQTIFQDIIFNIYI